MTDKPTTALGYRGDYLHRVKATCLYIATKLGDLRDDIVVVGGLVPSLLIDPTHRGGIEPHAGTMDLDLGLTVALLNEGRYRALTETLRRAGFSQDENEDGNPTRQRWKIEREQKLTIDFLIAPSHPRDRGGRLRNIEPEFAAIIAPGLHLAFEDRQQVVLSGVTIFGEEATRKVWVCGPGAYVVLKTLAFESRGENKDAYDLFYVLRNYGGRVDDVADCLIPLAGDTYAMRAIEVLRRDFSSLESLGPSRVAEFMVSGSDEAVQADVVGYVDALLRLVDGAG